jgi:hypothetical protein
MCAHCLRKSTLAKKDSFFSAFGKKQDAKKETKEDSSSTNEAVSKSALAPEPKKAEKKAPVKKAVIKNPEQERKRAAEESQILNLFDQDDQVRFSRN